MTIVQAYCRERLSRSTNNYLQVAAHRNIVRAVKFFRFYNKVKSLNFVSKNSLMKSSGANLGLIAFTIRNKKAVFTSVICVTAQHRAMLDQVLDLFKI